MATADSVIMAKKRGVDLLLLILCKEDFMSHVL